MAAQVNACSAIGFIMISKQKMKISRIPPINPKKSRM